ncbi:MAG: HD domain-containing protein [Firmicutes bacterium]|nr:HD domain-containing protein [Bacillota bacterium]
MLPYQLHIASLIIIMFIAAVNLYSNKHSRYSYNIKIFDYLLFTASATIIFDLLSIYIGENTDSVSNNTYRWVVLMFFLSLDTFLFLTLRYIFIMLEIKIKDKGWKTLLVNIPYIANILAALITSVSIEYRRGLEGVYYTGITAYICYIMGIAYIICGTIIFAVNRKKVKSNKRFVMRMCLILFFLSVVLQMALPGVRTTCFIVLIIILSVNIHIENYAYIQLEEFHREIVNSFANVIEGRDKSTGAHVRRTTRYVEIILEQLRKEGYKPDLLTDEYAETLMHAAPMHDIGKIAVLDAVLQKPERLTNDEYSLMKQHAQKGGEIIKSSLANLGDSYYAEMAYNVAMYHHEKWNGSGYPEGLLGENIPLSARIMAVADVFDAVSQDRCYRDAMTLAESFDIIRDGIGIDFDPVVATAFLNARDKVELACIYFKEEELAKEFIENNEKND